MKKIKSILLLLITSLALISVSCKNMKSKAKNVNTVNNLQQYVGEYMYEATGIIIHIYTKEKENDAKLYLFVSGDTESELIKTGEHKFAFKNEEGFKLEFNNLENNVFNELILIQPQGTVKAIRNGKVKIDDLTAIDKKLVKRGFSGVILVAKNDSIIFNKAYGKKNSKANGLNDINTVFSICSITKQFTAAGILKLSMQDKLSVNDKLSKYFDAVPKDKKDITIHQLLTHSSGLRIGIGGDYDAITEKKFIKKVFRSKLISPVGQEFHYSNMGYSLLTLIIEKVSGMDYETFLNENIFKPSKMYYTGYTIPNWKNNQVANGFLDGIEAKKPNEENWSNNGPYLNLKGNGGILSHTYDLLLWSKAIRNNIVLDKETTSKYFYPHFEYNGGNENYGYGWFIENHNSESKLIHHSGGGDFFSGDFWIYPKKDITIIVLSNTPELYVTSIARKISNYVLQE